MISKLEFRNITKGFPGVLALNDVSFEALSGEVTALVGENGAGKSTLLKILNGDYQPDSGKYIIDGKEGHFRTPKEAIHFGIGIIYQERQIVPYLSVAENVYMDELPVGHMRMIDRKSLNGKTQQIIDELGLPIKPTDRVKDLSVAYQQMVEIMKVYRRTPKIIAFDEPTASLSEAEIKALFELIEKLKDEGIIILYVSHRLKEIFTITDKVIIMKDGCFVKTLKTSETNEKEIVNLMVGRPLGDVFGELERNPKAGDTVLSVKNLTNDYIKDVSFDLKAGEVLGFAGLVGAGRTETMRAIFGADKIESGDITVDGEHIDKRSPAFLIEKGVALCPEDRKDQGIFGQRSVQENISVAILKKLCKLLWLSPKKEVKLAKDSVRQFNIKTPNIDKKIIELSGGNQQKVILARWLAAQPKVLILDEPTKGIDVGAKSEIYKMICALARSGIGIIVVSSELPEVLGLCDRIIVMCEGRIRGELMREEATEEGVLTLAMADM